MRTWRIVLLVLCAGAWSQAAHGQARLQELPSYGRYQLVEDQLSVLNRRGTISNIQWAADGSTFLFTREGSRFQFDLASQALVELPDAAVEAPADADSPPTSGTPRAPRPGRGQQVDHVVSPDEQWTASCEEWNVFLTNAQSGERRQVTTDGRRKFRYGKASWVYGEELRQQSAMWWSPRSDKLAFYEFDERKVRDFYLLNGLTAQYTEVEHEGYPKPGGSNPVASLLIYDLASESTMGVKLQHSEDEPPYVYNVRFASGGDLLLFNQTNRRQNVLHLMAADVNTGETRIVLTEQQPHWQDNLPHMAFLDDGHRFIWETERSGWARYELRDLDGRLLAELTEDGSPVKQVERVDEARGVMYYMAFTDDVPLNAQLHVVGLDGTGQKQLTFDGYNHDVSFSPEGDWFISRVARVGVPTRTILFDKDGNELATLADGANCPPPQINVASPELFTCKAADGVTDLYGLLYKPSDFDPAFEYPLLIDVYGGPLVSPRVMYGRISAAKPACELGFVIAMIDNRGTRNRGKAFEDAAYLKLGQVDLDDQVAAVEVLSQRPYIDAERVGIYGHSYGGFMAALAILKYPDVFDVAVASGAVTDWRNYDSIYTERFMRMPDENPDGYDAATCMKYADKLRGKLLLMHGMLDDNVHPTNCWQLIKAISEAGGQADMILFPDHGHRLGGDASTRRWEYLYQHLIANFPAD